MAGRYKIVHDDTGVIFQMLKTILFQDDCVVVFDLELFTE